MKPKLYLSESRSDHRGKVSFSNECDLTKAVRTYKVSNEKIRTVRAWHGHKLEEKWISVEEGEYLICAVKVNDFEKPNKKQKVYKFTMNSDSGILHIPSNFANGAMNITKKNSIRYFSSLKLEQSKDDDFRFDSRYWDPWSEFNPNLYE